MEENSDDEFYYPDEVEDESATFFGGYKENNGENDNSQSKIDDFINAQQAHNTVRKTRTDMNTLQCYLKSVSPEEVQIEQLPPEELDHLLSKFFIDVRKLNGEEYEPSTLTGVHRSVQRYLSEKKSPVYILKDQAFERSRKTLAAKRKSLLKASKGNKPQATRALSNEEEDSLFEAGQFGDHSPDVLQRTIWWFLSMHFGFRARDESRKLRRGDISIETDPKDGNEMLVWLAERGTKTRTGKEHGHQRAFQPKIFATSGQRCLVQFYKTFTSHRPKKMNVPEAPFYLAVKHNRKPGDPVWYMKAPLGKNEIGKFLPKAAEKAGLTQGVGSKISNHSVRKTSISRLLDADVPENFVAQLSGHKQTESLQSYKSVSHPFPDLRHFGSVHKFASGPVAIKNNGEQFRPCDWLVGFSPAALFSGSNTSFTDCNLQVVYRPVNFVQQNGKKRRRWAIIESDDEDWAMVANILLPAVCAALAQPECYPVPWFHSGVE